MRVLRPILIGVAATCAKAVIIATTISIYIAFMHHQLGEAMTEREIEVAAERSGEPAGVAAGVLSALIGAWWATRRRGEHAVRDGLIVGVVMTVFEVLFGAVQGDWRIASFGGAVANILGAMAGIALARLSRPHSPLDA